LARGKRGGGLILGRILAVEGAAASGGIAAIGVDNAFPAGEPAIAIRSADDEISGGIDQKIARSLWHPAARQRGSDRILDHIADHSGRIFLAVAILRVVLG